LKNAPLGRHNLRLFLAPVCHFKLVVPRGVEPGLFLIVTNKHAISHYFVYLYIASLQWSRSFCFLFLGQIRLSLYQSDVHPAGDGNNEALRLPPLRGKISQDHSVIFKKYQWLNKKLAAHNVCNSIRDYFLDHELGL
jgi:hypothetical protein